MTKTIATSCTGYFPMLGISHQCITKICGFETWLSSYFEIHCALSGNIHPSAKHSPTNSQCSTGVSSFTNIFSLISSFKTFESQMPTDSCDRRIKGVVKSPRSTHAVSPRRAQSGTNTGVPSSRTPNRFPCKKCG